MRTSGSRGAVWGVRFAALSVSVGSAAAVAAPGPAGAQSVVSVATTQAVATRQGKVVAGGVDWVCTGKSCRTSTPPAAVAAVVAVCQGLAREVGAIGSFAVANRALSSSELVQCNGAVPVAAAATAVIPLSKSVIGSASKTPAPRSYPVNLRTDVLTVTGTGRLTALLAFTPKRVRTAELTVIGIGRLTDRLPFTPKSIRTAELTVTGTGVIR